MNTQKPNPCYATFARRLTKINQTAQNKCAASNDLSSPWRRRYLALNPAACIAAFDDLLLKWLLQFCIFLTNPTTDQKLDCITGKPMGSQSSTVHTPHSLTSWYVVVPLGLTIQKNDVNIKSTHSHYSYWPFFMFKFSADQIRKNTGRGH